MPLRDVINQKLHEDLRFRVFPPLNPLNELSIDKDGLFSSDGVDSDDWVGATDRVLSTEPTRGTGKIAHLLRRVGCSEFL